MKTTDIYVEQVLMGLLVLLTVGLFAAGHWPEFHGGAKDVGLTFGILGSAYLLGILYDRFADTLLQNLEQHSRLRVAIERLEAKGKAKPEDGSAKDGAVEDPFPEEKLRLAILENGKGIARYADYLRSRIRLSRAMATILPALSVAYAIFLIRCKHVQPTTSAWLYGWQAVAGIYFLVFLLNLLDWPEKLPKTKPKHEDTGPKEEKRSRWHLRWECSFFQYRKHKLEKGKQLGWYLLFAARDPSLVGAVLIFGFLQWMVSGSSDEYIRLLPLAGLAATLFAGWVWYRINWTHLTLLRDYADSH